MNGFQVYDDLAKRTKGEFYLGVCGPVRTGKSTFIKRFMELMVLPQINEESEKNRAFDELPQSAMGKTIMTTEPKFIPKDAVQIAINDTQKVKVRLVDCVGYVVPGAEGIYEEGKERLVQTPWSDAGMPFTKAAEYGTRKVIYEHSTVGIVVTTDGSVTELPRQSYVAAEEKTITQLKEIGKPFVVILNSRQPYGNDTLELAKHLSEEYETTVLPMDCNQLRKDDVAALMEQLLSAFPVSEISFHLPNWVELLTKDHWLKKELIEATKDFMKHIRYLRDISRDKWELSGQGIESFDLKQIHMDTGIANFDVKFNSGIYYEILGEIVGTEIQGEFALIRLLKEYISNREEIAHIKTALEEVKRKGYGVVSPKVSEIAIKEPELIRHGNKYGVKIKALSPSTHLIQADIETEIAPIVGTEKQATDLLDYIAKEKENNETIWDINIFGKTIKELVNEGMENKVNRLGEDNQMKLQETIQKVINDGNGGLVCFIV